jgi:O-methyltransferase
MTAPFTDVYHYFPNIEDKRRRDLFPDIREDAFWEIVDVCRPYTLLSIECLYDLYKSVEYLAARRPAGDFVECGVFLGGGCMALALFADRFGLSDRKIHLYDTFAGFPEGLVEQDIFGKDETLPVLPDFEQAVEQNIRRAGLPRDRFEFVKGPVEDTLKERVPGVVSLLRLDTDYYRSTRVELEVLYPLLSRGGVLIVDDYGTFQGARRAVDEYFAEHGLDVLLHRLEHGCRSGIKA